MDLEGSNETRLIEDLVMDLVISIILALKESKRRAEKEMEQKWQLGRQERRRIEPNSLLSARFLVGSSET